LGVHFPTQPGQKALVFHEPVAFYGEARPSECYTSFAGGGAERPVYEASADVAVLESGALLQPYLFNRDGDCTSRETGFTLHELIYHLPPPEAPFHVSGVSVNLQGRGVGSSIEGSRDFDWTQLVSIFFGDLPEGHGFSVGELASVTLDVSMAQHVHGEWQFWPLLTADLFRKVGDYVMPVLFTGRHQASDFTLRAPAGGGADLLCHLKIRCTAPTTGDRGGRARLAFLGPGLGIHVRGVRLSGQFVQPVVEQ
jgi:hypothetical protein